mmetsp:Transcript_20610/g.29091  ORF Transcript_20610/g.29091 Transcript_20610/m.29091 type:complete len:87 (-) Transcript_20610:568-828(-)
MHVASIVPRQHDHNGADTLDSVLVDGVACDVDFGTIVAVVDNRLPCNEISDITKNAECKTHPIKTTIDPISTVVILLLEGEEESLP